MEAKSLLFWLLLLRSPLYPKMHLVHILPDHFHLGPDAYEILWKLTVITASLGISAFVIFFWRTVLAVKPPIYQVNLQQISAKINNFVKENRQLAENISTMEQKIKDSKKCLQETRRQNKILSHEALKFKDNIKTIERANEYLNDLLQSSHARLQSMTSQNVKTPNLIQEKENSAENMKDAILANTSAISEFESAFNEACVNKVKVKPEELCEPNFQLNTEKNQLQDASAEFEDSELRTLKNKNCELVEGEKNLKDICDALRSVKAQKEVELKMLKRNEAFLIEFYEQAKMAAEEKLKKKQCEWMERENQLSAAEENLKVVSREAHNYKQQIERMQEELQQEEVIFRHQISLLEKKAQDNWTKGRVLQGELAEQSREAACLRHRCGLPLRVSGWLRRRGRAPSVHSRPGAGILTEVRPFLCSRLAIIEKQGLQEKYGVPKPVLGRPETQRPPGRDTGPDMAPMRSSNSFPTKDVQKGQVSMDARGSFPFPGPPCMPYPMGCPLSPLKGCGPLPPPPPWCPLGPHPVPPHLPDGEPV